MYEGKNIHYSATDKKPLCSFSNKVCNQHRLNGYAFCVRHILEDPTAPFKRCAYVAKSSKQKCTQAIPQHEEREYCNNHLQVLGILPRKEKKKKENVMKDKGLACNSVSLGMLPLATKPIMDSSKKKFPSRRLSKLHNDIINRDSGGMEDPEDPYAFPDPSGDGGNKGGSGSPFHSAPGSTPQPEAFLAIPANSTNGGKSPGSDNGSVTSISKLYPELAEKLEKFKPRPEMIKTKDKGRDKSSRTLNILQSKIAQNRIKDKMKRNQESSSQSQSPSHFNHVNNMSHTVSPMNNVDITYEFGMKSSDVEVDNVVFPSADSPAGPSLQGPSPFPVGCPADLKRQQMLHMLGGKDLLSHGFKNINNHLGAVPPPPSLPEGIPHGALPESLPGMPRADHLPSHYGNSVNASQVAGKADHQHALEHYSMGQGSSKTPSVFPMQGSTSLPLISLTPAQHVQSHLMASSSPACVPSLSSSSVLKTNAGGIMPVSHHPPPPSYQEAVGSETKVKVNSRTPKYGAPLTNTVMSQKSPISSTPKKENLPPPPPYSAPHIIKNPKPDSKSSRGSKSKRALDITKIMLQADITKPKKIKKLYMDTDKVCNRLKTQSSRDFYSNFAAGKRNNHFYVDRGIQSSDEEDSDSEDDLLPWQPHWFAASSDEEQSEEDEDDQDGTLRTTKLALSRARLRRRFFQARKSNRANIGERARIMQLATSLISAVRESPKNAASAVQQATQCIPTPSERCKDRWLKRRQCCYINAEEKQCEHSVLPFSNHCLKHILFNVDQKLFVYCTAKCSDLAQCCEPVLDLGHESPLCLKHDIKNDNAASSDVEQKVKKPRKKTKPSALTRPPKKGKKKKNQRKNVRPQKPIESFTFSSTSQNPEASNSGWFSSDEEHKLEEKMEAEEAVAHAVCVPEKPATDLAPAVDPPIKPEPPPPPPPQEPVLVKLTSPPGQVPHPKASHGVKDMAILPDLGGDHALDIDISKMELPLEQASRLLEEHDFQDMLNKIPDETFDILGKNGDAMPSNEEVEELERHLLEANFDINFAQQMLDKLTNNGNLELDDEQLKQLAASLLVSNTGNPTGQSNSSLYGALPGDLCNGYSEDLNRTLSVGNEGVCTQQGSARAKPNMSTHSLTSVAGPGSQQHYPLSAGNFVTVPGSGNSTTAQPYIQHLAPSSVPSFNSSQALCPRLPLSSGQGTLQPGPSHAQQPQQVQQVYLQQVPSSMAQNLQGIPVAQQVPSSMAQNLQGIPVAQQVPSSMTQNLQGIPVAQQVGSLPTTQGLVLQNSVGNMPGLQGIVMGNDKGHKIVTLCTPSQLTATQGQAMTRTTGAAGGGGGTVFSTPGGPSQSASVLSMATNLGQQVTSSPVNISLWPGQATNIINFQNGYPQIQHQATTANFTASAALGSKFGMATTQHIMPGDMKMERAGQAFPSSLGGPHSNNHSILSGVANNLSLNPSVAFENQQTRTNFQRMTTQFSAKTGTDS